MAKITVVSAGPGPTAKTWSASTAKQNSFPASTFRPSNGEEAPQFTHEPGACASIHARGAAAIGVS
jgi:hypothetical protein